MYLSAQPVLGPLLTPVDRLVCCKSEAEPEWPVPAFTSPMCALPMFIRDIVRIARSRHRVRIGQLIDGRDSLFDRLLPLHLPPFGGLLGTDEMLAECLLGRLSLRFQRPLFLPKPSVELPLLF
ncbi:hypothetical protein MAMT_01714 [Methylacidimicrobium tartarophylax]|uniref:Uncharacterized protein n=1 Tax=Methylacidimicrobium tartarophylax TaxID=1041768 RepID=A0A5E6MGM0_9BACT|nr:hypothetical protein MAMT_01714 [Methylacidimicrobium tartarophylax]